MRHGWHWAVVVVVAVVGAAGCSGGVVTAPPSPPVVSASVSAASPIEGGRSASVTASTVPGRSASASVSAAPSPAVTESNPPGDIPDNQAYVAFAVPGSGVSVKVPEGWARTATGTATVFADKLNKIEIRVGSANAAPTVASVKAEASSLAASVPQFALDSAVADRRAGQPVVLLRYLGDSAQDPVTGKVVRDRFERYSYFQRGHRLDLTLSGPVNADNVDPWRTVSDSVRWRG